MSRKYVVEVLTPERFSVKASSPRDAKKRVSDHLVSKYPIKTYYPLVLSVKALEEEQDDVDFPPE